MTHADDPNKPKVTSPGVGDAPGADSDVFSSALDEALAALASPSEKGSRAAGDDDWLRVDDPAPPVTVTQTKPPKTAQPPAGAVAAPVASIIVAPTAVSDGLFEPAESARPTLKTQAVPDQKPERPEAPAVVVEVQAPPAEDSREAPEPAAETESDSNENAETSLVEALAGFGRLLKAVAAPKADTGVLGAAAQRSAALFEACPALCSLSLRGGIWWHGQRWLQIPAAHSVDVQFVNAAFSRAKRGGISTTQTPSASKLLDAAQQVVQVIRGNAAAWPTGTLLLLPAESNAEDPERWAAAVGQSVTRIAERAQASPKLPLDEIIEALDMVEQIIAVQRGALMRAIELRSGSWTTSWSTLASVAWVFIAGARSKANPRTIRAVALAQWCLATSARRGEQPDKVSEAATKAVERMAKAGLSDAPVCAAATGWLRGLSTGDEDTGPMGLIRLIHEAHRARVAGARSALAALSAAQRYDSGGWLQLLLPAIGPLPIGTSVNAGKSAVVVDFAPPETPLRPTIQVGQQLVRPGADLRPARDEVG